MLHILDLCPIRMSMCFGVMELGNLEEGGTVNLRLMTWSDAKNYT